MSYFDEINFVGSGFDSTNDFSRLKLDFGLDVSRSAGTTAGAGAGAGTGVGDDSTFAGFLEAQGGGSWLTKETLFRLSFEAYRGIEVGRF